MSEILGFLAAPFAACLVLVGALGYFGLHVLRREIIFADLALAQIAALGTVVGLLFGHEPGSGGSLGHSLATTTAGAAILSFTRSRDARVPQEALIGITYVVASAATILVADRAPEGAEQVRELLAGSILWVTWPSVVKVLVVCAAVGGLHLLYRKRFSLISEDPERAARQGLDLRRWDFLFYLSFGLVITLAVEVAGVLMVFAYLVAPGLIAVRLAGGWAGRMVVAWGVGLFATAAGMVVSYRLDMPSGPAIVCVLGALLLLFGLALRIRRRTG